MSRTFKAPDSDSTANFYDDLIDGSVNRSLWGTQSRFAPAKIATAPSTVAHYLPIIDTYVKSHHIALDIGCSTGGFTSLLAERCQSVEGIDLSAQAVAMAEDYFLKRELNNCSASTDDAATRDFAGQTYDIIQMVDVIHHLEQPKQTMAKIASLLNPSGKLIVFEPNKLNVALFLMCLADKNEWGALRFGSMPRYRDLLLPLFDIEMMAYNGLLIGPDSKAALKLADIFARQSNLLATQSPKVAIVLTAKS